MGAYIETGVIGFVFGEMWRRGVLTAAGPPVHHALLRRRGRRDHADRDPRVGRAQQRRPVLRRVRRVRPLLRHPARLAEGIGAEHARDDGGVPPRRGTQPAARAARLRALGRTRRRRHPPGPGRGCVPRGPRPSRTARDHGLPRAVLPRLPLRRDLDSHEAPDPTRPAHHQHLLRGVGRRRRGGRRAPARRARPGGAHLRGAPGARRALRRLPRLAPRPTPRRPGRPRGRATPAWSSRDRRSRRAGRLRRAREPGRSDGSPHHRRRASRPRSGRGERRRSSPSETPTPRSSSPWPSSAPPPTSSASASSTTPASTRSSAGPTVRSARWPTAPSSSSTARCIPIRAYGCRTTTPTPRARRAGQRRRPQGRGRRAARDGRRPWRRRSTGADRCSRRSATLSCTLALSDPDRRRRSSTTPSSRRSWRSPREVFALAADRGLDQGAVATVLRRGSGRSYAAEVVAGSGFDLERPRHRSPATCSPRTSGSSSTRPVWPTPSSSPPPTGRSGAWARLGRPASTPGLTGPPAAWQASPRDNPPRPRTVRQRAAARDRRRAPLRPARHRRGVAPPDRRRRRLGEQLGGPLPLRSTSRRSSRRSSTPPAADHQRAPAARRPLRPRRPALATRGTLPADARPGRVARQPLRVVRRAAPAPDHSGRRRRPARTADARAAAPTTRSASDVRPPPARPARPFRTLRIDQAQVFCLHAAADRERAVSADLTAIPFDLFVDALLDGVTGFLAAPASDRTVRHLAGAPRVADAGRVLL